MANDAQTLALAQTFYQIVRFSPADRKSQAVSKIQVALDELLSHFAKTPKVISDEEISRLANGDPHVYGPYVVSMAQEIEQYRRADAQRARFAELNRNPPPVELDPVLNAERN